jgi:hypothetical protein
MAQRFTEEFSLRTFVRPLCLYGEISSPVQ